MLFSTSFKGNYSIIFQQSEYIDDEGDENDIIELSIDEYSKSINDFSQDFLRMVTIVLVVFLNFDLELIRCEFSTIFHLFSRLGSIVLFIGLVGPSEFRVLTIKVEFNAICKNRCTITFIKYITVIICNCNTHFSMHVTLSMLASSASESSVTQKQLLDVLGRTENLENIEKYYETTLNDYAVRKILKTRLKVTGKKSDVK